MDMKTAKLWTRNFRLVILASAMGTIGAIAGSFALAFLVFDETGSTLASALIVAIQLLPYLLLPVLIAPLMDRLPRKAFLVAGDLANAILLAGMGLWLMAFDFSYVGYLALSLLLACLLLVAIGKANMWAAIFADVGVMVLAVLNAIRALMVKKL